MGEMYHVPGVVLSTKGATAGCHLQRTLLNSDLSREQELESGTPRASGFGPWVAWRLTNGSKPRTGPRQERLLRRKREVLGGQERPGWGCRVTAAD